MIARRLAPLLARSTKSIFLLGPRQTGKSTLAAQLSPDVVDFIVERGRDLWAIELKASRQVNSGDLRGLRSFAEYYGKKHAALVLYLSEEARRVDGTDVLPWQQGLRSMGL